MIGLVVCFVLGSLTPDIWKHLKRKRSERNNNIKDGLANEPSGPYIRGTETTPELYFSKEELEKLRRYYTNGPN